MSLAKLPKDAEASLGNVTLRQADALPPPPLSPPSGHSSSGGFGLAVVLLVVVAVCVFVWMRFVRPRLTSYKYSSLVGKANRFELGDDEFGLDEADAVVIGRGTDMGLGGGYKHDYARIL
ncbi:unnamed protein product [Vitrella brassicaformis CCMP3155]|uniref:Uncharacterized protein n=2 Tax=Vitrella brassicaformis TaxID=1169539 RepID=A0A0G4GJU0_VITBC|nr:unnamed protein product [Vitrella brassicaformis CCMP3155]|eukprot:CEM30192.1 unnamed protein product [Vitrella brassicaformis CCMP3155]